MVLTTGMPCTVQINGKYAEIDEIPFRRERERERERRRLSRSFYTHAIVAAADVRDAAAAAALNAGSQVLKVIPTHFFQQTRGDTSHVRTRYFVCHRSRRRHGQSPQSRFWPTLH